jgi:hypothetical protein
VKIHLDESRSSYTTRSLKDLKAAMPPFLSFDKYKNEENTRQILEIGCGTGHALVELHALLPNAKLTGTNKKGYQHGQSNNQMELVAYAKHYKVPIKCNSASKPSIPKLVLTDGIQNKPLDFSFNCMDLVLSHHALNQGNN